MVKSFLDLTSRSLSTETNIHPFAHPACSLLPKRREFKETNVRTAQGEEIEKVINQPFVSFKHPFRFTLAYVI